MPGTYRQLALPSISALKQLGPCPSISVPIGALGVSPSALFSAELGRSPLRLHRAQLRVLLCLEVTSTDPFPSPSPHHTQWPWSSCSKVFPALLPPCVCSHFAENGDLPQTPRVSFSTSALAWSSAFFLPSLPPVPHQSWVQPEGILLPVVSVRPLDHHQPPTVWGGCMIG